MTMSKEKKEPEEKKTPQTEAEPELNAPTAEEVTEETADKATETVSEADTLRAQLAEQNDKYLRILAEYDNFRRRSRQERESIYADVRADTVVKFLPVYDNLVRAAEHETDPEAQKAAAAMLKQFEGVLEGLGVTAIEAVGKKFDPALHNALLHIDDEKYGEGEIVLELTRGFKLGDKVIRFSAVQVAN